MNTVKIKPKHGLPVRKPDMAFLDVKGESVILDSYWQRRINQGDVVLISKKEAK